MVKDIKIVSNKVFWIFGNKRMAIEIEDAFLYQKEKKHN